MKFRLTAPHYLRHSNGHCVYYPTDAEVEWRGPPSSNMEPLDDDARAALAKAKPRGFDLDKLVPPAPPKPPPEDPGAIYAHDPAKAQAMRERTAKARAAAAAKRAAAKAGAEG